nr:MAG: hypothetical protein BECKFM1743C_GA0114222_101005 [Candidatus Kentron sp. FM]
MNLHAVFRKVFYTLASLAYTIPLLAATTSTVSFLGDYESSGDVDDIIHLGDQAGTEYIRQDPDGTSFSQTFDLPDSPKSGGEFGVYVDHRQVNTDDGYYNYVYINGVSLGYLSHSAGSSDWSHETLSASTDLLMQTGNTLEINAGLVGSNYDDF